MPKLCLKRPIKWFNIGEHYRYERPQKGRLRAFYQFNADILGEGSAAADAELMSLLVHTLKGFGLDASDFKLRLSDRDLWLFLLQAEGLDRVTSAEVLGIIDKIERTSREKSVEQLTEVLGDSASAFMAKVEGLVGIREFSKLESYFAGLAEESSQAEAIEARLEEWRFLLKALESSGAAEFVEIDLGIVRGLAYYTGFVFEAFEASGEGRALAGGGRYDDLVGKLGSQPMPAVGFAMGDVTLGDLLEKKGLLEEAECGPDFIFIIGGEAERAQALGDAAVLRSAGYSVEYPLKDLAFGKQFKAANQRGARFAIIYGSDELEAGVLKVRDLGAGKETNYPREDLVRLAESLFEEGSK